MNPSSRALLVLLAACCACSKPEAPTPRAVAVATRPASAPAAAGAAPAPASGTVTGAVVETMNAASYTYVRVHGANGDIWAAAPEFAVRIGEQVRVSLEMPMVNFHSASLKRDFPLLYFVTQITPAGAPSASAPAGDPHAGVRSTPSAVTTPMPAPAGGVTIAALWANRTALAGKPVTVHGVVVKLNAGILGLTWIHLQDGTGSAGDGSNDITVTAAGDVAVKPGDTAVATGLVGINKDIGSGYSYPVIVEQARITVSKTTGS